MAGVAEEGPGREDAQRTVRDDREGTRLRVVVRGADGGTAVRSPEGRWIRVTGGTRTRSAVAYVPLDRVDLLIGLTVVAAALGGIRAGSVRGLWVLLGFVVSLLFAIVVQGELGSFIADTTGAAPPTARGIALLEGLLVSYVLYAVATRSMVGPIVRYVRGRETMSALERGLGLLPSALQALLVCVAGLAIAVLFAIGPDVRDEIDESRLARELIGRGVAMQPSLRSFMTSRDASPLFRTTTVTSDRREALDVPVSLTVTPDDDAEATLLGLVNAERAARGRAPVTLDRRLTLLARLHSQEMFRLRYFGHVSPVTGSPLDRLNAQGITHGRSAEALAYSPLAVTAHLGLMENGADRATILDPGVTRVGIGVASAEPYGLMATVVFIEAP